MHVLSRSRRRAGRERPRRRVGRADGGFEVVEHRGRRGGARRPPRADCDRGRGGRAAGRSGGRSARSRAAARRAGAAGRPHRRCRRRSAVAAAARPPSSSTLCSIVATRSGGSSASIASASGPTAARQVGAGLEGDPPVAPHLGDPACHQRIEERPRRQIDGGGERELHEARPARGLIRDRPRAAATGGTRIAHPTAHQARRQIASEGARRRRPLGGDGAQALHLLAVDAGQQRDAAHGLRGARATRTRGRRSRHRVCAGASRAGRTARPPRAAAARAAAGFRSRRAAGLRRSRCRPRPHRSMRRSRRKP